jgi:hypothetical protein
MSNPLEERIARLEDIEAIRYLDAQYCRYLDDGRWDDLMSLFTEDGSFDGLAHPAGKKQMKDFFSGLAPNGLGSFWHFITNMEIDVHGNEATVRSFLWQPCVLESEPSIAAGRYTDSLIKIDGSWLYRVKQVRFHFFGPLKQGWAENQFAIDSARHAAVHA